MDNQTLLGDAGSPFTITWTDEATTTAFKLTVGFLTVRRRAQFEEHLKTRKLEQLKKMREDGLLPPARFEALVEEFYADCESPKKERNYSFDGDKSEEYRNTTEGTKALLRIVLSGHEKMTEEQFDEMVVDCQEDISQRLALYQSGLLAVAKELGWDVEANPEGKGVDPKALRSALKKRGIVLR